MKGQPLSEEVKQKMREGRERARLERQERRDREALSATVAELPPLIEDMIEDPLPAGPIVEDAREARRARWLSGMDPEVAKLVTDEDLDKIEREENEKALGEKKRQALADLRAMVRQEAQAEHNLIPAATLRSEAEQKRMNEPVTFRVNIPGEGSGHRGQAGFRVNGRLFQNGHTYTEPRHVFTSLFEMHYRVHLAEVKFRTLDQHKIGNSAVEVLGRTIPQFEVTR